MVQGSPDVSAATVGRFLREERGRRRWTLQRVSDLLAERGRKLPVSTLARIERGELDPGIRRLFPLLRLYDIPPNRIADLLEIEERSAPEPEPGTDLGRVFEDGKDAWRRGDVGKALAYYAAVRDRAPDTPDGRLLRQKAILCTSIAALNLGKLRLAAHLCEELLCDEPHSSILVNLLVHAAATWKRRGGHEVALSLLDRAQRRLETDDGRGHWVEHQRALVLDAMGRHGEAAAAAARARELAGDARDPFSEAKIALTEIRLLAERGLVQEALWSARKALQAARRNGFEALESLAGSRLGALLAASGDPDAAGREFKAALARAITSGDPYAEFLAHHGLWKLARRAGDEARARLELESCRYFLQRVDDTGREAEEVRAERQEEPR